MTPLLLLDDLCAEIAALLKDFRLEAGTELRVLPGFLADTGDQSEFLYVMPRLIGVQDDSGGTTATIAVLIGASAGDGGGWRDCWNLAERIRRGLLQKPAVSRRFRLELPVKTASPDLETQPYPEAVCWITTNWTIPQPMEEVNYGDEFK